MPEGPSLVIAKEIISPVLRGKRIIAVAGDTKAGKEQLIGKKISTVKTWGKHLLIVCSGCTVRVHFLMFGTYSINEEVRAKRSLRLAIYTGRDAVYFYTCGLQIIQGSIAQTYDWEADVLSEKWNPVAARKKLKAIPQTMVCDALLDQAIFSGIGNIIKNEVLYRIRLHPETLTGKIPPRKLTELIKEARIYSFDFLKWKKAFVLKKHWLAHTKKTCLRCDLPLKKTYSGKTKRRTFFCANCQVKY